MNAKKIYNNKQYINILKTDRIILTFPSATGSNVAHQSTGPGPVFIVLKDCLS